MAENSRPFVHQPVLFHEVMEWMRPQTGGVYLDCTLGGGGHAEGILKACNGAAVYYGIDRDTEAITAAGKRLAAYPGFHAIHGNFHDAAQLQLPPLDGILIDLGVSSFQLDTADRGFSYHEDAPLDMRMDTSAGQTAAEYLATVTVPEFTRVLREYGEERFAGEIAENIVAARKAKPIIDTFQLVEIIKKSVRGRQKIHPATRTFQALRIAVNDELNNLEKVLPQALQVLRRRGRLVIISFHSLEDRIVKKFLEEKKQENLLEILTRKPISPSPQEIKMNRRARSAKLRAAQKTI